MPHVPVNEVGAPLPPFPPSTPADPAPPALPPAQGVCGILLLEFAPAPPLPGTLLLPPPPPRPPPAPNVFVAVAEAAVPLLTEPCAPSPPTISANSFAP